MKRPSLVIALGLKDKGGNASTDATMRPTKPQDDAAMAADDNEVDGEGGDKPLQDDDNEDNDIEFALPTGQKPPGGTQPGDTFTAKATLELQEDGKVRVVAINGSPLGLSGPDDAPAEPPNLGADYASKMAAKQGAMQDAQ